MRTNHRRLWALAASAALVLGACTSTNNTSATTVPGQTTTSGATSGDRYNATIVYTSYGIPHVTANDIGSLGFGQGYAFAADHACTLAEQVVKVRGEWAKYLGPGEGDKNITSDFAYRNLGLHERAAEEFRQQPSTTKEMIEGYAAGFNHWLATEGATGLPEWCRGQAWVQPITAVDLFAYYKDLAILASSRQFIPNIGQAQPPGTAAGTATTVADLTPQRPEAPGSATTTTTAAGAATTTTAASDVLPAAAGLPPAPSEVAASNGWAFGSERTENGQGMVMGNPHFPWGGDLRLWESQLTIPGELNVYGVGLLGVPGVLIGFNEDMAWTHTFSDGRRFTVYGLDLVPGDPTSYRYGNEVRSMTPKEITIEVLQPDGTTKPVTRTMWSSHYGPIATVPGVLDWSDTKAYAIRDANIDNDELVDQWMAFATADSLEDYQAGLRELQGTPWVTIMAASKDGRAWFIDPAATPNLSPQTLATWEAALESDPLTQLLDTQGATLLDGSDPANEWVAEPGARDPGLVPFDKMPQLSRDDFVFNANDSYWLANPKEPLTGYSPMHGRANVPQTPRTRENARTLLDTSPTGPAGPDGKYTVPELAATAIRNHSVTADLLRAAVVQRCTGAPPQDVDGQAVDITAACAALAGWDGVYDTDRVGAIVFRELLGTFTQAQLTDAGPVWATPFDAANPVETPSGLAPAPPGGPDPILQALGKAVVNLQTAGVPVNAPLGVAQWNLFSGAERIPIHGGQYYDGITNVNRSGSFTWSQEPPPDSGTMVNKNTGLHTGGYPVDYGASFVYAMNFTPEGPEAVGILTYGQSGDPTSEHYLDQNRLFSNKEFRPILFDAADVAADTKREITVSGN